MDSLPEKLKTYDDCDELVFDKGNYKYQPNLTEELDKGLETPFNQDTLNKIVLWKVNRYVQIDNKFETLINKIDRNSNQLDEDLTREILGYLLSKNVVGIRLPMASTILRYINPKVYQIIDQRAFRFAMGKSYPKNTKVDYIELYIDYLRKLREISVEKSCDFTLLDRILYQKDKHKDFNKGIPLK